MFGLIKQVLIVLLKFSSSLAHGAKIFDQTKCLPLNDEPCMVTPSLIDLNPVELKYYPFMFSLSDLQNYVFQKRFHVIVYETSILQHVIQIKNGIIKHVNMNVKIIVSAKNTTAGILAHVFVRIASI